MGSNPATPTEGTPGQGPDPRERVGPLTRFRIPLGALREPFGSRLREPAPAPRGGACRITERPSSTHASEVRHGARWLLPARASPLPSCRRPRVRAADPAAGKEASARPDTRCAAGQRRSRPQPSPASRCIAHRRRTRWSGRDGAAPALLRSTVDGLDRCRPAVAPWLSWHLPYLHGLWESPDWETSAAVDVHAAGRGLRSWWGSGPACRNSYGDLSSPPGDRASPLPKPPPA